jgi:serine O-acetyltransferase
MSTSIAPNDPQSLREAFSWFRRDFARWVSWLGGGSLPQRIYWFLLPSIQALLWFRIARSLYITGWKNSARLISLFSLYLTRIEIPPTSSIGPECLISHAEGVIVCGRIGARCVISGSGGIGGGAKPGDVGGGPGLPWVGDDVFFGQGAAVFGAVRVGSNVTLGANTLTLSDVPSGAVVIASTAIEVNTLSAT